MRRGRGNCAKVLIGWIEEQWTDGESTVETMDINFKSEICFEIAELHKILEIIKHFHIHTYIQQFTGIA